LVDYRHAGVAEKKKVSAKRKTDQIENEVTKTARETKI